MSRSSILSTRSTAGRASRFVLLAVVLAAAALLLLRLLPERDKSPDAADGSEAEVGSLMSEAERLHEAQDHERSAAAYARAAELALRSGDLDGHWSARAQRGVCLKMLGRTEESRAELLPALDYARTEGKRTMEALALGNLARCASIDGDLSTALAWEDALADVLDGEVPTRQFVLTLEQAAMVALQLGDVEGAILRLRRALEGNAGLPAEDDQSENLTRELAWALSRKGDDEGALVLWGRVETSAAGLARQAVQLSELGRHEVAAQMAWDAARLFEQEDATRLDDRDDALVLSLGELVRAGRLELCRERLAALFAVGSDPRAEAPFRLVEGRLELAAGRPAEAAVALRAARDGFADDARAEWCGWLLSVALIEAARPDEGLAVLDEQPDSLPSSIVRAWYWAVEPPGDRLASERLPLLASVPTSRAGDSLALLRRLCPVRLPTPAFLVLHLWLQDADRLRGSGRPQLAEARVREGVVRALSWTAREECRDLTGDWPASDDEAALTSVFEAWAAGRLAEDAAVAAVIPGTRESYLVLCTRALGATTFGLPPGGVLHEKAVGVAESLRGNDITRVLSESLALGKLLFGLRALVDLEHVTRLFCVWPEELTSVPPGMLLAEQPSAEDPFPFLVRRFTIELASLVAVDDGAAPLDAPLLRMGEPRLDATRSRLALPEISERYGAPALSPGPLRADEGAPALRGDGATSSALRSLGPGRALELSLAGFGGDHFGGLVLSRDDAAPYGDEQAGFLPWRRLPDLSLPELCVLDRTRFDPHDAAHGPLMAADAVCLAGARAVLLARWPLPAPVRDDVVSSVLAPASAAERGFLGRHAERVTQAQRAWLDGAQAAGDVAALHPRRWAGWLAFGTPRSLP